MPYIETSERPQYEKEIRALEKKLHDKPVGHINYVFSRIIWGLFNKKAGYTFGNALMGMLRCVALEFYRRKLAEYENEKITENGDL